MMIFFIIFSLVWLIAVGIFALLIRQAAKGQEIIELEEEWVVRGE